MSLVVFLSPVDPTASLFTHLVSQSPRCSLPKLSCDLP